MHSSFDLTFYGRSNRDLKFLFYTFQSVCVLLIINISFCDSTWLNLIRALLWFVEKTAFLTFTFLEMKAANLCFLELICLIPKYM